MRKKTPNGHEESKKCNAGETQDKTMPKTAIPTEPTENEPCEKAEFKPSPLVNSPHDIVLHAREQFIEALDIHGYIGKGKLFASKAKIDSKYDAQAINIIKEIRRNTGKYNLEKEWYKAYRCLVENWFEQNFPKFKGHYSKAPDHYFNVTRPLLDAVEPVSTGPRRVIPLSSIRDFDPALRPQLNNGKRNPSFKEKVAQISF